MKKITYGLKYAGVKQKFARSVVAGGIVFVSGSSGRTVETGEVPSDDIKDQLNVAYDKIKGSLEEAGSSLENICKITIYLKDMSMYAEVKQAEWEYWEKNAPALCDEPPCSTVVQISSLSKPNMLIEIDVFGVLND